MTPAEMAALRALAEAASKGWDAAKIAVGHNPHHAELVGDYIAAAHPGNVLALLDEVARLRNALIRLRDCDWVITPLDRMDAVRDIARAALEPHT